MEPRKLKRYDAPKYPTRHEVTADPSILARRLPPAWRRDELLGAVAAFAAAANSACTPAAAATPAAADGVAVVAPVSKHGEGFASSGCDVVAPPVFLSEEEALKVIKDEAAKRGLTLVKPVMPIAGVKLSLPEGKDQARKMKAFKPDLVEVEHHLAIEFVSGGDEYFYRTPDDPAKKSMAMLVENAAMQQAAEALSARVKATATEKVVFGAFYDPGGNKPDAKKARQESKAQLREQVVDFLDWLKAQGAL